MQIEDEMTVYNNITLFAFIGKIIKRKIEREWAESDVIIKLCLIQS